MSATCPVRPDPPDDLNERMNDRFSDEEVDSMRLLRDTRLTDSKAGQRWAALFREHSPEVFSIFQSDSKTMQQVDSALLGSLPLIRALANPKATTAVIESKHVSMVEGAVKVLRGKGSPKLQADLDALEKEVDLKSLVGSDVRAAWDQLVTKDTAGADSL